MGSFKSAAARAADIATLTAADRPLEERDQATGKVTQEEVPPEKWLQEGEWVRYFTRLPHAASVRLTDASTTTQIDQPTRRVDIKVLPGTLAQIKLVEGIVDWNLLDENNQPVKWSKDLATELLSGVPQAVLGVLQERIGAEAPDLSQKVGGDGRTPVEELGKG